MGNCIPTTSTLVEVTSPLGGTYGIDPTEVTRLQYAKFVLDKGDDSAGQISECQWNTIYVPSIDWPPADRPFHPVVGVDWCDARAYCAWAGKRLCGRIGGDPFADNKEPYTTTAQFFNACSGGGTSVYPYGDSYQLQTCNGPEHDLGGTVPVASMLGCSSSVEGYAGVFDLSGNVWEWEDYCEGESCYAHGGSFGWYAKPGDGPLQCTGKSMLGRHDYQINGVKDIGFRCCSDPYSFLVPCRSTPLARTAPNSQPPCPPPADPVPWATRRILP